MRECWAPGASAGGRIAKQGDFNAVVRYGKATNHVLHLILTLVTLGFWAVVWLGVYLFHQASKRTITLAVDGFGNVLRQQVN
jgi:hypothetical protein